jgi:ribokinase
MRKILVIGSSNTDLIAKVKRFPAAGETVQGEFFLQAMGGKGANQALAAHRLGGYVRFITAVGKDANGQNTLKYYQDEGLDVSASLIVNNIPTGTAMILVNEEGENCIVVTPGANHSLTPSYIEKIEDEIATAFMVVLQMEIPFESVRRVCELALRYKTPVLLNVAPAREVDAELLRMVDILVVNETEIEMISGKKIESIGEEAVIDSILAMGAKSVILTLGQNGCIVRNTTLSEHVPAFRVEAVDTTAAGDTFCGSLVARLSKGADLAEAIRFATAASALCVMSMGAQPSIPHEEDVKAFLKNSNGAAGKEDMGIDKLKNKSVS